MELTISHSMETDRWLRERHYLKSTPAGAVIRMEFREAGELIGAMMWGRNPSPKQDQRNILCLTRMFFVDEAPNKKCSYDGMTFDSKRERDRYCELRLLQMAGKISDLRCQVRFELVPEHREPDTLGPRGGRRRGRIIEKAVVYVADFVYQEDGKTVVEDAKGHRTEEYIIKRKLMLYLRSIRIREV